MTKKLKQRAQFSDAEHKQLTDVGNEFWAGFSKLVATALAKMPPELESATLAYIEDKCSAHGSAYQAPLEQMRTVKSVPASAWSKDRLEELAQLGTLLDTLPYINNGSSFLEKLKSCMETARNLTKVDLGKGRAPFIHHLIEQAHRKEG